MVDEQKEPKTPLITFYLIALAIILCLNFILVPFMNHQTIEDVDYGTFMTETDNKNIDEVEIMTNKIRYTLKGSDQVYQTGLMEDAGLVERLHESGAKFSSEIVEQTSPFLSFVLYWILPIVIFSIIGYFLRKQMMKSLGGENSMMFGADGFGGLGMGKSNARVYVKSSDGIKFSDVAVRRKRRKTSLK